MAEKDQQVYPLAPAHGYARSDPESQSKEFRRRRNKKRLTYCAAFIVFQTIVVVIFSLTVMKVKRPKFRVRNPSFETFNIGTAMAPSFNMRMNAQATVKNTNFGEYKFDEGTVTFSYRGTPVGEVTIAKSKAKMLSTKKIDIVVDLASTNLPTTSELGSDISSGILTLTSQSTLNGKVALMMVMKKKKASQMNCNMEVVLATQAVQNLNCK